MILFVQRFYELKYVYFHRLDRWHNHRHVFHFPYVYLYYSLVLVCELNQCYVDYWQIKTF